MPLVLIREENQPVSIIGLRVATTLLLNASFEPLKVISWQRAITMMFLGKVEVVEEYDHEVRSVSLALRMPCVVRLLSYVKLTRRRPPLSRLNLLARDGFSCQYCSTELSFRDATIDHILPRSQGGTTTWLNVVAACHHCNRKKGGRTPMQAAMKLRNRPYAPDWLPVLTVRFRKEMPPAWVTFLETDDD